MTRYLIAATGMSCRCWPLPRASPAEDTTYARSPAAGSRAPPPLPEPITSPCPHGRTTTTATQTPRFLSVAELTGLARLRFDMENIFINPIPAQAAAVTELLADPADAVLTDSAFLGAIHLLLRPRTHRPPVLACGVFPLSVSSRDTAPFGLGLPPSSTRVGRARNHLLNLLTQRLAFAGCQRKFQRVVGDLDLPAPEMFYLDALPQLADRFFQLTVPGFEYPRSDQPPSVVFAGPVLPALSATAPLPDWWGDLDGHTVVHVTQGTIDNQDLSSLIGPDTSRARRRGRPDRGRHRRTSDRINLLAHCPTMPGYRVHPLRSPPPAGGRDGHQRGIRRSPLRALAHGVPLVVAGASEDKPEVAARVRWSGTGINLRTGRPTQPAIRGAVRSVLHESSYRLRAAELRADMAQYRPLDIIESSLARV